MFCVCLDVTLKALARVLSDEWKKRTDLATVIVYIFFCLSSFSQFHPRTAEFKIGSLCMTIIEHELKQYDSWLEELKAKKAKGSHRIFSISFSVVFFVYKKKLRFKACDSCRLQWPLFSI